MFSMLGHTLSNLIDTAFHTGTVVVYGVNNSYISDVDYEKTGYLGTLDYFTRVKSIAFGDPEALRRVMAYTEQCFIPYVSTLNESELDNILKEKDLFGSGKLEIPLNLIMKYDGKDWYCKDFYENMVIPKVNNFLSNVISTPSLIGFTSYQELQRYKSVINALTNGSYSVTSAVSQPAVINAIKTALVSFSSDSPEFNREILSAYLVGEAEGKFKLMAKALGDLAKDLIPSLAIAMQFLVIVASSTIALLFLLPQAQDAFWRYVKLSAWIHFWSPALATLDALAKIGAIYKIHSVLLLTNTDGLTIASVGKALAEADQVSAIGGYLALSVPGIAWLLLQGSEYVVASLAQSIMGRATQGVTTEEMIKASTAEKIGYETTGTIGEGFHVRSALFANPTSMAHAFGSAVAGASSAVLQGSYFEGITDASMGAGAGTATYRAHGGSTAAMMETGALTRAVRAYATPEGIITQRPTIDGEAAYQNFQKRFDGNLFQTQLTNAHRKVLSEKLSQTYQELQNLTTENAMSTQAGYREFVKFEDAVLNQYRDGAEYSKVLETSETESLREMRQIRDSLEKALGIDKQTATRVVNDLAARLSFDANFERKLMDVAQKGKIRKLLELISPNLEDKINVEKLDIATLKKTLKELGEFTRTKGYEKVLSAVNKLSMNDSIAHSLASSYQKEEGETVDLSKVRSLSERIAYSLHKATTYERQEQALNEKGDSFSIDLSQKFIEWYAQKTGLSLNDAHESLNRMAVHQPLNLEILATEFSEEYADEYKVSDQGLREKVIHHFRKASQEISGKPESFYAQGKLRIENKAEQHGAGKEIQEKLQKDFSSTAKTFKQTNQTAKEKIHLKGDEISADNLPSWSELYREAINLAPDNAVAMLHSDRLSLLGNNLLQDKLILGGTAASNLPLAYDLTKKLLPFVGRVVGAAGTLPVTLAAETAALASMPYLAYRAVEQRHMEDLQKAIQSKEQVNLNEKQLELLPKQLEGKYLSLQGNYNEYRKAVNNLSPVERIAYGEAVGKIENQYGTFLFTATGKKWEGGYHSPTYSVMWTHDGKTEFLIDLEPEELYKLLKTGNIK